MKKTSTLWIRSLLIFISFLSGASSMEVEPQQLQGFNTFRMIHAMFQGVQKAFNPPASPSELESDQEDFPKMAEALEVMNGGGASADLLTRASELVADVKSTHPNLKSSDYRTIAESAVRVGMKTHPRHFSPLEEGLVTPDAGVAIFGNFFQTFTQEGALDGWLSIFRSAIEAKESDPSKRAAYIGFLDYAADLLKTVASGQSPLDKYADPKELEEACALQEWLEKNQGHRGYDKKQSRFRALEKRVLAARDKAMYEGCRYVFDLLKLMQSELAPMREMSEVIEHQKTQWALAHRAEFEVYILTEYGKLNPFEPNHLRGFWEKLEGHQYGKLCYEIVCESFEGQRSDIHQLVRQIWEVSQLDTINARPQEARSRMPGRSFDGMDAANFGYRMKDSPAYKVWVTNPLARASGDVIMDAYHSMVSFSRKLNTDLFLKRFKKYVSYKKKDRHERTRHPHKYDRYMIAFERYLLERVFHKPIIPGQELKRTQELKKAAGSMENLMTHASRALAELKKFSNNVFSLRPSKDGILIEASATPFVFGIGFNGKLFDSPNPFGRDENEIWLAFSKSERNEGGYLLLSFMRDVAELPSDRLARSLPLDLSNSFDKYKPLIRKNISQRIKDAYYFPDSRLDSYMLRRIKGEREKLEDFMWQLEQKLPFAALDPKLQEWIEKTSNWYRVPRQVSIKVADELDPKECLVQEASRELLFDAIAERPFSQIHPSLREVWDPEINKQFREFKQLLEKEIGKTITKADKEIAKLKEIINKLEKSRIDVVRQKQELLAMTEEEKLAAELKIQELPTLTVQQLSREQYERFRAYFFKTRDVSQCIEPLFAKVLGHDRFFSVFISNKSADYPLPDGYRDLPLRLGNRMPYDVIAPCDKNCQHHALGHLYVGDMLADQSVDHLDHMRQIHGLGEVADRFMRFH